MYKVQVLGCSGGIGGQRHTTSFLVSENVLVDAGSGVLSLSLDQMSLIDHIFITHSHLDHILSLPLIIDSVGSLRSNPLIVYALPEVIHILKEHVFNNKIWPDFTCIPNQSSPYVVLKEVEIESSINIGELVFTSVPANHVVPACGWEVAFKNTRWMFAGDTAGHPSFWERVSHYSSQDNIVVEVSFTNEDAHIAEISGHYCPSSLANDVNHCNSRPNIWITHLKPGDEELIMNQLGQCLTMPFEALHAHQEFILQA